MVDILIMVDNIFRDDKGGLNLLGKLAKIVLVILAIKVISHISNKIIDRTLKNKKDTNFFTNKKRANTIGEILKKIVRYILYFIATIMFLEMFNINTSSILATAGVGGLAIGFGAQSLVKDVITGFFILFEDQYVVGDHVKIESYEGNVEELGLRVTKLRDFSGDLHIIPNGRIQLVTNKTRGPMRALVKVQITYEEDLDRVTAILENICKDIGQNNDSVLDGPSVLGITDFGESDISITIVAKTRPMDQWAVERQIRKRIKEAFTKENIETPYPRRIIGGKDDVNI